MALGILAGISVPFPFLLPLSWIAYSYLFILFLKNPLPYTVWIWGGFAFGYYASSVSAFIYGLLVIFPDNLLIKFAVVMGLLFTSAMVFGFIG